MLFEFIFVLDPFDTEKDETEQHRDYEPANQQSAAGRLRSPDGENHGQTAADEDSGIGGAESGVNGLAGGAEIPEVPGGGKPGKRRTGRQRT